MGVEILATVEIKSSTEVCANVYTGYSPSTGTIGEDIPVDERLCSVESVRSDLLLKRILNLLASLFQVALHLIVTAVGGQLVVAQRLTRGLLDLALDNLLGVL